jgi:hypothetical protein
MYKFINCSIKTLDVFEVSSAFEVHLPPCSLYHVKSHEEVETVFIGVYETLSGAVF